MTTPLHAQIFAFAVALLIAVLLSKTAHNSVLSTAVIFLVAGFLLGSGALNLVQFKENDQTVGNFVQIALFSVLITDGMKTGARELLKAWRLPGTALLLGLPLTLVIMAVLARFIVGFSWLESMLIGAVLSPTDPVFASTFISRSEVPKRVRHLLNVESGLNDGLALPIVLFILSIIGVEKYQIGKWISELLIGIAIGIVIPWIVLNLQNIRFFSVSGIYKPMFGLSIALLVYSLTLLLNGNLFLAGFSTGITVATLAPTKIRESFLLYAEPLAELLKLGAVLIFGALLSWNIFAQVGWTAYLYVVLVLLLARPLALLLALINSPLDWQERVAAAWFGPRGFASVVYGLLVLASGVPRAPQLFQVISIVIIGSIVAHSTTDTPMASWFKKRYSKKQELEEPQQEQGVKETPEQS